MTGECTCVNGQDVSVQPLNVSRHRGPPHEQNHIPWDEKAGGDVRSGAIAQDCHLLLHLVSELVQTLLGLQLLVKAQIA